MLNIGALITSFFLMITGFFAGLPNTVVGKPTQTVTDSAKVLALYKDIAAKNTNTQFRERIAAGDLVDGRDDVFARVAKNWAKAGMFFINPRFFEVTRGLPGNPNALTTGDIRNAKAEYYNNGKTVVISFTLPEQVDRSDGGSNNQSVARAIGSISKEEFASLKVQVARLGFTMKSATITYKNASVMIRADVASGKIVKANIVYTALATAVRNETTMPFSQSFNYTFKLP